MNIAKAAFGPPWFFADAGCQSPRSLR